MANTKFAVILEGKVIGYVMASNARQARITWMWETTGAIRTAFRVTKIV